jgi:hypothetical protein
MLIGRSRVKRDKKGKKKLQFIYMIRKKNDQNIIGKEGEGNYMYPWRFLVGLLGHVAQMWPNLWHL